METDANQYGTCKINAVISVGDIVGGGFKTDKGERYPCIN
jgi:hypothetical protein